MLSLSKPKRKRKKQDDLTVWFGDVGSTISRKRPRHKKRKKQVCCQQFSYLFSVFHLVLEIGKFSCYSICFDHWSLESGGNNFFFNLACFPSMLSAVVRIFENNNV